MIEWHPECRTDDDKIIEWEKNERYFWVTSIFYSHSGLIPSFLMRKNEKNQIPPTRDQKIVTLDWMNPILNDGLREPRGRILNKGQTLRFFSSSFQGHFTEISSFQIHSVTWMRKQISVLKRGWSYASKLALLMNPIPSSPSAEGDGGIGLHKCFRMIGNESGMISLVILNGK